MSTITIPAGLMYKRFTINTVDDSIVECSESFNVTIVSVTDSGVTIGNVDNIEVVIVDNDSK